MSYEQHRKSAERKKITQAEAGVARTLLLEANEKYIEAIEKYQAILEDAEKEVTPELIMEAYQGYKEFLKGEMSKEKDQDEYGEVIRIAQKLKELDEIYLNDKRLPVADEIADAVREQLERHGISEKEYPHYLKRAAFLAKKPGTNPVGAVHTEIHSKEKRVAESPFTGWVEERPGGHA